ncbi:MAG: zinc ABC transporter substrate-binding protein [Alphaproteobacteria bacterium]|nr:zinc ABC transporter substrate-binding protein [Alphaproteobacteria bacterium]
MEWDTATIKLSNLRFLMLAALAFMMGAMHGAEAATLDVVAAENFYGDIAQQIGGTNVAITSILSNPDQDPHEFEAGSSAARQLANAALVIYNGLDYDPWVPKLLAASSSPTRQTIVVAELLHKKAGDNPHIWYDPEAATALAKRLSELLARRDPDHAVAHRYHLAIFEQSLKPLADQISKMRRKYAGTPVTATEPVFGYMADALGLEMRNRRFQLAVMNDTEPSAADIAKFETDLRSRAVKVLICNRQTSDALTRRMREIAQQSGVPVVGVTETEPAGKDYQQWMRSQLDAIDRALAG